MSPGWARGVERGQEGGTGAPAIAEDTAAHWRGRDRGREGSGCFYKRSRRLSLESLTSSSCTAFGLARKTPTRKHSTLAPFFWNSPPAAIGDIFRGTSHSSTVMIRVSFPKTPGRVLGGLRPTPRGVHRAPRTMAPPRARGEFYVPSDSFGGKTCACLIQFPGYLPPYRPIGEEAGGLRVPSSKFGGGGDARYLTYRRKYVGFFPTKSVILRVGTH